MMGMPKKGHFRGGIEQPFQGLSRSENIFVFILKCAVDENYPFGSDWSRVEDSLAIPDDQGPIGCCSSPRQPGDGIKIIGNHHAGNRFVMIPANSILA